MSETKTRFFLGRADAIPDKPQEVHRAQQLDIDNKAQWLMPRLREAYPSYGDTQIINFLRNCIPSPDWFFIASENAILLAQVVTPPMRKMRVDEEFCIAKSEDDWEEAAGLYRDLKTWASHIGASKLCVDCFSDVPRDVIGRRVGKVTRMDIFVVSLETNPT
jgi:hypothetical protein